VRQPFNVPSDTQFADTIRELLADISNSERIADVKDTDDLFDANIIDSFGVLQVIEKIEDKFDISIPNEELVPQNLWSVAAIIELIKRLSAAKS
jgi:D-alanine--poly(phosphoribitol) ligase subunit 2